MSVSSVFQQAVSAYNERQWDTLCNLLDDYVILKRVNGASPPFYFGKASVLSFLQDDANTDNPTFIANSPAAQLHGNLGTINGVGLWKDSNGNGPIQFEFTFINRLSSGNPDWKIVFLWGSND
jgi:hypothetical protein